MINHKLKLSLLHRHSFLLKSSTLIPEFQIQLQIYSHPSAAQLIHLRANDPNQAFAVIFSSRPNSDKGTPHILEHLICCGSEKFPIRDPFMAMIKRSLNTYLNAWTGEDYICFPFATLNTKDFLNLQTVVLDLVFRPTLSELDFRQEGHRLDFVDNKLLYKGVVYNEMKGAMQSADSVFIHYLQKYLLNGTPYQFNSGGNPQDIPQLSYEELKQYYSQTFHPSNAIFYQYGQDQPNFDLIESYLNVGDNKPPIRMAPMEPTPLPLPEILPLPKQDGEQLPQMSFSYLLQASNHIDLSLLYILNHVLFDGQNGLLYSVIEDGLASAFGKYHGYEVYGDKVLFNIAFSGASKKNFEKIRQRIAKVLKQLEIKFPQDKVEAALHQIEVQSKMPRAEMGIKLLQSLMNPILFQKNIADYLLIDAHLKALKDQIAEGRLSKLVKESFSDYHLVYAEPDPKYLQKLASQEEDALQKVTANVEDILKLNEALNNQEESDFSILPKLEISEIQPGVEKVESKTYKISGVKVHEFIQQTNGLTFFKFKFNMGFISEATRQYLDMFASFINKVGTKQHSYSQMSQLFSEHTLGLDISYETLDQKGTHVTFSISCLNAKVSKTIELLTELLTAPEFSDKKNFNNLLRNQQVVLQNQIIEDQLQYATEMANRTISYAYHIMDVNFSTKFQLQYIKNYLKSDGMKKQYYLEDFDFFMQDFLYQIVNQHSIEVFVHHDGRSLFAKDIEGLVIKMKDRYKAFTADVSQGDFDPFQEKFVKQAALVPTQVNCCSRAYKIPYFTHPDVPKLQVLADYFSNEQLHREIREIGGAYGAGCKVRSFKGILNFWSYQDPNILGTFDVFDKLRMEISDEQLDEAKLTVFQRIDQPVEPYNKGVDQLLFGYTEQQMADFRRAVLEMKKDDVAEAFEKYIKRQPFSQAVMASEGHCDVKQLKDWVLSDFVLQ